MTRCGAESFMIRDGVCDEKTNIEACLWDGGDCCLDNGKKDRTLCKDCICRVTVDNNKLIETYKATHVKMFQNFEDLFPLILRTEKTVPDVFTGAICSTICLDLSDVVNSWAFDGTTHTCICSWLKSTECITEMDLNEVRFFDDSKFAFSYAVQESFVQLTKLLHCSMTIKIIYIYIYIVPIALYPAMLHRMFKTEHDGQFDNCRSSTSNSRTNFRVALSLSLSRRRRLYHF